MAYDHHPTREPASHAAISGRIERLLGRAAARMTAADRDLLLDLNGEVSRGRIRYLGASNWTSARIAEANAYAQAHGLPGFVISEPQWSLACRNPAGDLTLGGQLTIQGGGPGAGKVLTYDAAGVAAWVDPPFDMGQAMLRDLADRRGDDRDRQRQGVRDPHEDALAAGRAHRAALS